MAPIKTLAIHFCLLWSSWPVSVSFLGRPLFNPRPIVCVWVWGNGYSTARSRPLTVDCGQNVINLHIPRRCLQINAEAWLFNYLLFNTDFYRTLRAIITVPSVGFVGTGYWRKDRLAWPRLFVVFFSPTGRMTEGSGFHFRREKICSLHGVMIGSGAHPASYNTASVGTFQWGERIVWLTTQFYPVPRLWTKWYVPLCPPKSSWSGTYLSTRTILKILLCALLQLLMISCGPCI
jgi:hypothetical protein